jgi:LuxR family transcriptional regulator, maltose regulon positive regulatory protein
VTPSEHPGKASARRDPPPDKQAARSATSARGAGWPRPPGRQDRHPRAGGTLIGPAAAGLAGADRLAALPGPPARHLEALTHGETRVLHYLPTNLSAREIAGELHLSVNTVKTHQRHRYQKLGARSRTQAVEQARAAGLIAPSSRRR